MSDKRWSGFWRWVGRIFGGSSTTITKTTTTTIDKTTTRGNQKRALCIGINNYPGRSNDLRGCVNDAKGWKSQFEKRNFDVIKFLIDSKATKKNVKNEMLRLVKLSQPGDVLVITYSGHGTTVKDKNNDEADGKDEAICLHDSLMIDDEIRAIIGQLKDGISFTFISDSCHSGTISRAFLSAISEENYVIPRFLPPKDNVEAASLAELPVKKGLFIPQSDMKEILLSGCLSSEYSYDAYFNGMNMGAFSHHALLILRDNPRITYKDFYKKVRASLPSSRYPQTPQLEGSDENKNSIMFE